MQSRCRPLALIVVVVLAGAGARAHDTGAPHAHEPAATVPLDFITETEGPVAAPPAETLRAGTAVTGHGFWRFVAARDKVPVPPEALPKPKGAHGTLVVEPETDSVYWGLQGVGWIAFTDGLTKSAVIPQDPVFKSGNLHGADILPRPGERPLVAVADDVTGRVYLSDTGFEKPRVLGIPALAPCLDGVGNSPGPIAIVNLRKRAVVATLKPKDDLGYDDALHIHDACWYVTGTGDQRQVSIVYTNWNPGGIGALKVVNVAE